MTFANDETAKAYFCAIGRFVFEFSQLEFTLTHHLGQAIGLQDDHVEPVMAAFDFAKLCSAVEKICASTMDADGQSRLKKVVNSCRKLNEDRVRIAHGLWVVGPGFGSLHSLSRSSLKRDTHFEDHSEIEALADTASRLRSELIDVVLAIPRPNRA